MPLERFGGDKNSDYKDHISPYKIAILVVLKEHSKFVESMHDGEACTLILNIHRLIQIPDMDLASLFKELKNITSFQFLEGVKASLHQLCNGTVHLLHELMDETPTQLLYTPHRNISNDPNILPYSNESFLSKGSRLGIFVRRMSLSFDKLSFNESCRLYTSLCSSHKKAFPQNSSHLGDFNITTHSRMGRSQHWIMENGDVGGGGYGLSSSGPLTYDVNDDDDDDDDDDDLISTKKYSYKQANYFVAQQAYLLNHNEFEALPPKELHSKILELLKCHPNFPEAHFLKYMNFLRVREFKASLDSLFSYFDRTFVSGERSKAEDADPSGHHGYRYAALNVAAMAYRFGHRKEAMSAILECIKISQQNNDSVCLQHALSWLHRLEMPEEGNPIYMLERLITSSNEYNLPELASMGLQSYAKQSYSIGAEPSVVFENMMASDVINSDHDLADLLFGGFAQKSALWNLYGYDHLNKINNFLILDSTTKESQIHHNGEPHCLALCHVARVLSKRGDYDLALEIVDFLKRRYPQMSNFSHIWILCNQQIRFQMTLLQGNFNLSDRAIREMSAVNGLEGSYCRCVYLAETGELERSLQLVDMIIDRCKLKTSGVVQTNDLLVRCLLLKCNICCSLDDPTAAIQSVVEASMLTREKYFNHVGFMVLAHVALLQLKMEMNEGALSLLSTILSDSLNTTSTLDHARVLFLYVRCWMAYSNRSGSSASSVSNRCHGDKNDSSSFAVFVNSLGIVASSSLGSNGIGDGYHGDRVDSVTKETKKRLIMKEMLPLMEEVCCKFRRVKAYHRLKDALLFQAMMYNDLGMVKERNRTSLQYNQVESQLINSTVKFSSALF